jgi:alpha-beta hydrolase superfamily lysophospholipase
VQTVRDEYGVDVAIRVWDVSDPAGLVVLSHGASEHSGRYARFASALNDAGYAAFALDHRGHGATAPSTGPGRLGPGAGEALLADLGRLLDIARENHPTAPVILVGHSVGALVALAYATRYADRLHGLVLSGFPAAAGTLGEFATQLEQAIAAGLADEPAPSLAGLNAAFEPARTPYDWLSRDEVEVDRYIADPLCGDDLPLTFGFMSGLFSVAAPALEPEALVSVSCPVLLVGGDHDPAAAMGEHVRELARRLTDIGVDVTTRLYADARHELLNEINRDEVTADVVAWLLTVPTARSVTPGVS